MIRLSDALFISSEPDYDTVIAIRIKNGEYYFLGWMENTEGYKYVIAKHPEENLLDRDCFSDANSLYCNIISCDGYNDAYLLAKNENPYSDFLSNIKVMREMQCRMLIIMTSSLLRWMKSILFVMH